MSDVGGISGETECVPLRVPLSVCVCVRVCACVCVPWCEDPGLKTLLMLYS